MYFITVIRVGAENKVEDFKTIGFTAEREEAERLIRENDANLFEGGKYQYAIISLIEEGMYPSIEDKEWYNFQIENNYWIIIDSCEAPEGLEDYEPYIMG